MKKKATRILDLGANVVAVLLASSTVGTWLSGDFDSDPDGEPVGVVSEAVQLTGTATASSVVGGNVAANGEVDVYGDDNPNGGGSSCTATTCAALGATCGSVSNGCGGTKSCGTCGSGQTCNASNQCVATTCTPSCPANSCGSDGCGGTCECSLGMNCNGSQCEAGAAAYYNTGKTLEATPNFGPNVKVYTPASAAATIQTEIEAIYAIQHTNQFGLERHAILFTPGTYSSHVPIGFNTQIAGLGDHPDAVNLTGWLEAPPDFLGSNNGTQTFWRFIENFKNSHTANMLWAVSQAAPMRRVHVTGSVDLHRGYGWQSGGFIADSVVDGYLLMGSQQQWYTRNSHLANSVEGTWNIMYQGVTGTKHQGVFPNGPMTDLANAPVIREKPFLYVNRDGKYRVFVPAIRTNASGPTWTGTQQGTSIPLSSFHIAREGTDTATTMNNALASGKHLLITPGVYHLSAPLAVNNANTVLLGLGLATLIPDNGVKAITVADVDGVQLAGLLIDAGTGNSPVLVEVGPTGSSAIHAANPTSLHDIFTRIGGGTWIGKAEVSLLINSKNVIIDHVWLWRADHSDTPNVVRWDLNTATNGLVVNGSSVTSYGTFVEHFQQYQVLWNGNNGKNFFFQNELPYEAPDQPSWMNGSSYGWASYKVADGVANHESYGMGCYAVFTMKYGMQSDRCIEAPDAQAGVKFRNIISLSLTDKGKINNLINNDGRVANPADFSTYPKLAAWH